MIIQAELRRKQSEYEGEPCSVDKVIELPALRFQQFSRALLADYDFIAENKTAIRHDTDSQDVYKRQQQGRTRPTVSTNAARKPTARFIPQALLFLCCYPMPRAAWPMRGGESDGRGDFRLAMGGKVWYDNSTCRVRTSVCLLYTSGLRYREQK